MKTKVKIRIVKTEIEEFETEEEAREFIKNYQLEKDFHISAEIINDRCASVIRME